MLGSDYIIYHKYIHLQKMFIINLFDNLSFLLLSTFNKTLFLVLIK